MLKFEIDDLHCMSCVNNIKDAIQEQDSKADIDGDIEKSEIYVRSELDENKVKKIISEAGYKILKPS